MVSGVTDLLYNSLPCLESRSMMPFAFRVSELSTKTKGAVDISAGGSTTKGSRGTTAGTVEGTTEVT